MALRYVARRFAISALRRASGPRVSPSACSGPPASRFYHQAGYSNGDAEKSELLAKYRASIEDVEAALRHMEKMDKLKRRLNIASFVVSASLALLTVVILDQTYGSSLRNRAYTQ